MGNLIDWNNIVSPGTAAAADFGDPRREFDAVRSGAVVTPLRDFGLLRIHGDDAGTFLQGQLTCDLDQVTAEQAQFGGYCTPKGRLLANFVLMAMPQGYLMCLPADVATSVADRLRKFVLRSKVKIEREGGWHGLGLAGPATASLLEQIGAAPKRRLAVEAHASTRVIRLSSEIILLIASSVDMPVLWNSLAKSAIPAGTQCWSWVQIQAGLPWITQATQDQFLPQMIGLDAIGGVSFEKGCYTGQEIVARTHYLGEVKRKLRMGSTRGGVKPGDALMANGEQCGTVLNAAQLPEGDRVLLAVVSEQATGEAMQTAGGESVDLSAPATLLMPG